jgi:hypothetical protein
VNEIADVIERHNNHDGTAQRIHGRKPWRRKPTHAVIIPGPAQNGSEVWLKKS